MKKTKYLIKIPGLKAEEQTRFIYANFKDNMERLRIACLAFIIIELIMLILHLLPNVMKVSESQRKYFIILYLIIIPFLILFIYSFSYMQKKITFKNMFIMRIIVNTGLMAILVWSFFLILFGYKNGFLPNAYILIMVSMAVIPYLSFWEIISIMIPSQALLTIYVLAVNPFSEGIAVPLLMDSWSFCVISILISVLFYSFRISSFKKDLKLMEQNDKLKQHSEIDALTDIFNRRKLDEVMAEEWQRSSRTEKDISFLLIDLDL